MKKSKISYLSLRTKIFVFTMMPFVLVIIIISILSIQNRIKNERELTSNRIESYVTLLESGDLSFNSIKQKEKIEKFLNEKVLSAELIKRDRSIAFTTGGHEYEINKEQIDKAFQGYIITFTRQNKNPVLISLYPIIVKNTVVGILHLELSFEKSNNRIRQYTLFVLFLNIFGIILSFLLIYFLSKKIILNRLKSLTDMCFEIRRGNLNHQMSVKSHDELGRLALTFNDTTKELAERNQQLKEEKQKVLDNIRENNMTDPMDKVTESKDIISKIRNYLAEYIGYFDRENRRSGDKLLRDTIAQRYEEQWSRISELQRKMIADGKIESVDDLEAAALKLRAFVDRIKTASYGYAGFFDVVTVKSFELEEIYKYDLALLEGVDDVSRAIDNVDASIGTDGMPAAVSHLTRLSQGVIDTYNRRDEVILSTDA